jgi:hypothetical protein
MKMKTTPKGRIGRMLSLDSGTGMSVPYDLIAGAVRHPETRTIFKVLNIQIDGCMREVLTYAP